MSEEYKIRFYHGLEGEKYSPIYSYHDLSADEYDKIRTSLSYQRFLRKIEKAYELIVHNYRDYEKNNFSIILNETLRMPRSSSRRPDIHSIDRHILNILTSTSLYLSLLAPPEKNNDECEIARLKLLFKKTTNTYHSTRYEYTFMSALRDRLAHGKDLLKQTYFGGTWSTSLVDSDHDKNLKVHRKDKRFSLLDTKVSKAEAKNIIDKKKFIDPIETQLQDEFYLRNCIRVYVDLLSLVHAELREAKTSALDSSNEIINEYLSKGTGSETACIIIKDKTTGADKEVVDLVKSFGNVSEAVELIGAPLGLEHYRMPGEHENRPTN